MSSNALALQQSNIIPFPERQSGESILLSCQSNEWYTPLRYIEAARKVMGSIELDPASCEQANQTVRAMTYFTKNDNGLDREWIASSMFINPPYGRTIQRTSNTELWIRKLIREYETGNVKQAILLIPTRIETRWFQLAWAYPICFTDHRIAFNAPHKAMEGNIIGSAFVYLGTNEQAFIREFSKFGHIAKSIAGPRHETVQARLWGAV